MPTLPPAQEPVNPPPAAAANNPFSALLHSRKFWVAVFALLSTLLTVYLQIPDAVIMALNGVFAAVVAAIAYEDAHA